jgi:hypothetical protein
MDKRMDINSKIKEICDASIDIKRCIEDNLYLCERLNLIDKNLIRDYYKNEKSGVVIDIRKEVCKVLLLDDINVDLLIEIINKHKESEPKKLKSWANPYKILHPLVNVTLTHLDEFINQFIVDILSRIGDVKYTVSNFNGSQHQGSENYWVAFYNKEHRSQSEGLQLFLDFFDGKFKYGIYQHKNKSYLEGPFEFKNIDDFYNFVELNKNTILNEAIDPGMTFIDAAKFILNEFENKPMTSKEIWDEIDKRNLVRTSGKTPQASLNTVILNDCVDSPVNGNRSRNIFKIVEKNPAKFILNNYMSKNIKETMISNGFITIDMLKEIFEKNGLDFKI